MTANPQPMSATDRERNYIQPKFPDRERQLCTGLIYLTGPQLRRIRHKIHHHRARGTKGGS